MSALKEGSLFSGYHGLGMGVASVLDVEPVWFSEFDKGPSKILAHRFPDVPNHGDITKIDWSQVEPVDILTGGSPCQDLSHAGARKGMTEGTRSNLWVAMREAIAQLKPSLVVWENVGGAFSANADSEVEPCPGCVGDGSGVNLRALGRVLGDLASLGFDAEWTSLRAADIGAPHGRLRVFVVAYPAGDKGRLQHGDGAAAANRDGEGRGSFGWLDTAGRDADGCGRADGHGPTAEPAAHLTVLPTPTTRDWKDHTIRREPHRPDDMDTLARALTVTLLPTPAVNDMGASYTPDEWDAWTDRMKAEHGNGNGHGKSLHIEAARLLPTPAAADAWVPMEASENTMRRGDPNGPLRSTSGSLPKDLGLIKQEARWGQYAAAIQRWESLTRPAPAPTELGPKGNPRLSAGFSEWMMGLPAGWVTDVPGITRNEALKALGNGVVPQQAAAALRMMLGAAAIGGAA